MDHGPDLNVSRNVAKRTLGNNFKTKKRFDRKRVPSLEMTEPSSLEGLQCEEIVEDFDIDDPVLPAMDPKFYHDPMQHSSRTYGHKIKKNLSKPTKYPHKVSKYMKIEFLYFYYFGGKFEFD